MREEQGYLAQEWKHEAQRKKVERDAEKLALLTREPKIIAQFFNQVMPSPEPSGASPLPISSRRNQETPIPMNAHSPLPEAPPLPRKSIVPLGGLVLSPRELHESPKVLPRRGDWVREVKNQTKSFNAGLDKLELMSRISEKLDLHPRPGQQLNETFDVGQTKKESARRASMAKKERKKRRQSERESNINKAAPSAFPWEQREASVRQNKLLHNN